MRHEDVPIRQVERLCLLAAISLIPREHVFDPPRRVRRVGSTARATLTERRPRIPSIHNVKEQSNVSRNWLAPEQARILTLVLQLSQAARTTISAIDF